MAEDDPNWLKNPILPRPPALPRFSAAELRLIDDERPPSVRRAAPRKSRALKVETVVQPYDRPARLARVNAGRSQEATRESKSEAPRSRRIA